jgi:hypothetical protein
MIEHSTVDVVLPKREEGRGKREEERGKREEGREGERARVDQVLEYYCSRYHVQSKALLTG